MLKNILYCFGLVYLVLFSIIVFSVQAETVEWIGGNGFWNQPSNWSSNPSLPGLDDDVYINRLTPVIVTHSQGSDSIQGLFNDNTLNISGGFLSVSNSAYIGYLGTDAAVNLSDGTLAGNEEYIGWEGNGTFVHSGGTNQVTTTMYVGVNPGGIGLYQLITGDLSANYISIGHAGGSGVFEQTNGINTVAHDLLLGSATVSTSPGKYTITDGLLDVQNGKIYLGQAGQGTFELNGGTVVVDEFVKNANTGTFSSVSGGTGELFVNKMTGWENGFTINGSLAIGHSGGAGLGDYTLINGQNLTVSSNLTIGNDAKGTMTQSGGANNISNRMFLGRYSGSEGTYELSDNGALTAKEEYLGFEGKGTFIQSGGTNQVTTTLYVGDYTGATGLYQLNTGELSANNISLGNAGGSGVFEQTGGTNTVTRNLFLGGPGVATSNGKYTINNGTLDVHGGKIYVGQVGQGTFELSGGKVLADEVVLNSQGILNLTAGTLVLKALSKGSGPTVFNFGGGTLQASNNLTTTLPMTLTGIGGNANLDSAGKTVELAGVLSGTGGLNKMGAGTLILTAKNSYGGNTTVNGGTLEISAGIDTIGTSLIDVQSGAAVLKTVNVNKPDLDINTAASATFEVVNGTHMVGAISGSGITQVDSGASLTVKSIRQDIVTVGAGGLVTIGLNTTIHTWNGDGANNLWMTKDNWDGDVEPSCLFDNLVFPAGAKQLDNVNNNAPGTQFGTITVSGDGYKLLGNAIQASIVEVLPNINLQVNAINANLVTIGSGATLVIAPNPGGPLGMEITPVPEPSLLALLAGAFSMSLYYLRSSSNQKKQIR